MKENTKDTLTSLILGLIAIILASIIIGALNSYFFKVKGIMSLDITHQQHVYSYDTEVYLEDKKLESCAENGGTNEQTDICKFSCAPEGLCVFIPKDIVKYHFE